MKREFTSICDWCGNEKKDCVEHKDMDEGAMGRSYDVCRDCRIAESKRIAIEELQ